MCGSFKVGSECPHLNVGLEAFIDLGNAPGVGVGGAHGSHAKVHHLTIHSIEEDEVSLGPSLVKLQVMNFMFQ